MKTGHRLIFSVIGGFFVMVASYFYLQNAEKKIHAQQKMVTVIVAKRFIPAGKAIKPADTDQRKIPEAYIQPGALGMFKAALRSRRAVMKGEQITKSNVLEEGAQLGMAWALAAGASAVSLALPPERAVGGLLVPGDRVDVLCVMDRQPDWQQSQAFALFLRKRVLAVNDQVLESVAAFNTDQKREMSNETILVTLEASLEQAAQLALAQEKGRVTLTLASPLDATPPPMPVIALGNLKR